MKLNSGRFRFRKMPEKRFRLGAHSLLLWYYSEKDGSPVLIESSRWWKISGALLWYGKYEIIFRKRGMRSL